MELNSQNFSFEATLRNCILETFSLRQFCGIVFSKYSLWGNFTELYSQNISFEATLRSCIFSKHFLWGNSVELYYQNITFEAILLNCILKTFPLRQLCGVVFSQHFLWGNFTEFYSLSLPLWGNFVELYSHTFIFRTTLQSCIPTNVWGHYIPTWIN